ncbi:MAG: phosphate ABC transporter permease subunit PstC, partial [Rikenellaceae bacterium]
MSFKRIFETIIEKILMASGAITSLTIILIVVFLFKEGGGLFRSPVIEEGFSLVVNSNNDINKLSPIEIKEIFDAEITSWAEVESSSSEDILVFRLNDITSYVSDEELGDQMQYVPQCITKIIAENPNIIAFVPTQYLEKSNTTKILDCGEITPTEFFGGKEWYPTSQPAPLFGVVPL